MNQQFAIDLIDEVAPIEVDSHVVWCDGGKFVPNSSVLINDTK